VVSWVAKPGGRCQQGNSGSDPLWPAGPCPRQCAIQLRVRLSRHGSVSFARAMPKSPPRKVVIVAESAPYPGGGMLAMR